MATKAIQIDLLLNGFVNPNTGLHVDSGTVYFYEAGSVSTPKNVWTEKDKTNAYTSYQLGTIGQEQLYGDGEYKIVVKDSSGNTVSTIDNVRLKYAGFSVRTITADYTQTVDDDLIYVDTTSNDVTISMLASASWERQLIVQKIGGSNTLTLDPNGSETIDGSATYSTTATLVNIIIGSDGSNLHSANAMENIVIGGVTVTATAVDLNRTKYLDGYLSRPVFVYNGGSTAYTIKVGSGVYMVSDKIAQWSTQLTTTAISSPVASTWYYLYLDYSAITSETAITNSELIWSTTAPTWSDSLLGWYNGSDRCIFACLTNAGPTNIYKFYQLDGNNWVYWDGGYRETNAIVPASVDMTSSVPAFSYHVELYIQYNATSGPGGDILKHRINLGTYTLFHSIGTGTMASISGSVIGRFHLSDSQVFDYIQNGGLTIFASVYTTGWQLPFGM